MLGCHCRPPYSAQVLSWLLKTFQLLFLSLRHCYHSQDHHSREQTYWNSWVSLTQCSTHWGDIGRMCAGSWHAKGGWLYRQRILWEVQFQTSFHLLCVETLIWLWKSFVRAAYELEISSVCKTEWYAFDLHWLFKALYDCLLIITESFLYPLKHSSCVFLIETVTIKISVLSWIFLYQFSSVTFLNINSHSGNST